MSFRSRPVRNALRVIATSGVIVFGYMAVIEAAPKTDTPLIAVDPPERAVKKLLVAYIEAARNLDLPTMFENLTGTQKTQVLAGGTMGLQVSRRFLSTMVVNELQMDSTSGIVKVSSVYSGKTLNGTALVVWDGDSWKLQNLAWENEPDWVEWQPHYDGMRPRGAKTAKEVQDILSLCRNRNDIDSSFGLPKEAQFSDTKSAASNREKLAQLENEWAAEILLVGDTKFIVETFTPNLTRPYSFPVILPFGSVRHLEIDYYSDDGIHEYRWIEIPDSFASTVVHKRRPAKSRTSEIKTEPTRIVNSPYVTVIGAVHNRAPRHPASEDPEFVPRDTRSFSIILFQRGPAQPSQLPPVKELSLMLHPRGLDFTWQPVPGAEGYRLYRSFRPITEQSRHHANIISESAGPHCFYLGNQLSADASGAHVSLAGSFWFSVVAVDGQQRESRLSENVVSDTELPYPWASTEIMDWLLPLDGPITITAGDRDAQDIFDISLVRFSRSGDTTVLIRREYSPEDSVDMEGPTLEFVGRPEGWADTSFIACRAQDFAGNISLSDSLVLPPDPLQWPISIDIGPEPVVPVVSNVGPTGSKWFTAGWFLCLAACLSTFVRRRDTTSQAQLHPP